MAIVYTLFNPATAKEPGDGGPTKDDLVLQIETAHYAATQETPPNQRRIARLEKRHARVLAAPDTRRARKAMNDAVLAEQTADREGRPDD